MKFHNF